MSGYVCVCVCVNKELTYQCLLIHLLLAIQQGIVFVFLVKESSNVKVVPYTSFLAFQVFDDKLVELHELSKHQHC